MSRSIAHAALPGAAVVLLLLPAPALAARTAAPTPDCADARQVAEMRQPSAQRIVLATTDGGRFRVSFADACPDLAVRPDAALLARDGWLCGSGNEYARAGGTLCPISTVERIDAAEYAAEARASLRNEQGTIVLDTVTVRGEARRGFSGSPNFCLNPRWMRGWSEDREGLRVEMRPRRAGGNRWYRVELGAPCPELAHATSVQLSSGPGIGLVCGNAGDRVLVQGNAIAGFQPTDFQPSGTDLTQRLSVRAGCPIVAVYPIHDD